MICQLWLPKKRKRMFLCIEIENIYVLRQAYSSSNFVNERSPDYKIGSVVSSFFSDAKISC